MHRVASLIDIHVIYLGAMISLLLFGLASVITFAPGPRMMPAVTFGSLPVLIMLSPMIVTRVIDRRRSRGQALPYLLVNVLLALSFALLSGLLVFSLLPLPPGHHP